MFLYEDFSLIVIVALFYGWLYSRMSKEAFGFESPIDPYYFAFTTMSTVGYGDFSPKTPAAKALVMSQQAVIMTGVIALLSTRLMK
jgi:voltage-gated potassium channel